jgi:hypothetical protein
MINSIGIGAAVFGVIIVLPPNYPVAAIIFRLLVTFFSSTCFHKHKQNVKISKFIHF